MTKRIEAYSGKTLRDLEWKPGEVVAVHYRDPSEWYDFVLMDPIHFTLEVPFIQDYPYSFLGVSHSPSEGKKELWRIAFQANAFLLQKPEGIQNSSLKPKFRKTSKFKNTRPYEANVILAGKDEIARYLRENESKRHGADFYADCIEDGRLRFEKSLVGIIAEIIDLSHTSDRIRFRG